MKKSRTFFLTSLVLVLSLFVGCKPQYHVNILSSAGDGLDLKAVTALLQEVNDAEDFEKKLNSPELRINNLDLNEDNQVDYIKVTEYGEGDIRGFSLTVETGPEDEQEVATIEIQKESDDQVQCQTKGNEQIYGSRHYYHSHFGISDFLLWTYIWSSHRPYRSGFGYNRYPGGYSRYSALSGDQYKNQMNMRNTTNVQSARTSAFTSANPSPNAGKVAKNIKAPLKNPTATQRAFQQRNPSRSVRSGGFGTRSVRSSTRSRSFGGGSFGK
ncbi:MAG: hypothetical protein AAF514_02040 [Verrucomicrobiota bacterium]